MVTVFKDLHMPAIYSKTIVKITRKDNGKMVKNAKNQQKQGTVRGKRKLEEAKKQKNPEEIGEMTGKGKEDASKMIKTENMIAVFENLHVSPVSNRTIVMILEEANKQDKFFKIFVYKFELFVFKPIAPGLFVFRVVFRQVAAN